MTLLEEVKIRCGIPENITVYDESEIKPLIEDAIADMKSGGVPESILPVSADAENADPRAVTAVSLYVLAYHGQDRADTEKYLNLYHKRAFKLSLEPEGTDV